MCFYNSGFALLNLMLCGRAYPQIVRNQNTNQGWHSYGGGNHPLIQGHMERNVTLLD